MSELFKLQRSRGALKLDLLGGANWVKLRPLVQRWWADLKAWEAADTFEGAFLDDRMTVRQINLNGKGGDFPVPNRFSEEKEDHTTITLARDVAGVKQRFNPTNFFNPVNAQRLKNALGLHDLSASLMSHKKPIRQQLKHYEDTIALFVPVPLEEDLELFYTLNSMGKRELNDGALEITRMRSELTRIKLAQASDMGTTYGSVARLGSGEQHIRYGITGTIIKVMPDGKDTKAYDASEQEIKDRRTNALRYKSILDAVFLPNSKIVNEVVMAYRSHASPLFPLFGEWDKVRRFYRVLDSNTLKPSGPVITNEGKCLREAPALPTLTRAAGAFGTGGPPPPPKGSPPPPKGAPPPGGKK